MHNEFSRRRICNWKCTSFSSINSTIPSTSTVASFVDCGTTLLGCLEFSDTYLTFFINTRTHTSTTHSIWLLSSRHCMHIWCNRCSDSSHQHIFVWFLHQNSAETEQQPLPCSRKVLVLFTSSHWRHFLSSSFSPSAIFSFRLRSAARFFVAVEILAKVATEQQHRIALIYFLFFEKNLIIIDIANDIFSHVRLISESLESHFELFHMSCLGKA